jgi:metallophosphoesterase superfamily enzyme
MKSVKIRYVGKALLVEENGKRVLALGDLHFGFGEAMREGGYLVDGQMYNEIIENVERIFERVGRVDEIVLVGDLKHVFGGILKEE